MDIQELAYFRIVCEQKSITRAARYLYMSQQGLSKIIKNIENELNATLLIRKPSGIELTQADAYLYAKLPGLLHDYESLQEYPDREVERRWTQGHGNVAFLVGNNIVDFPKARRMEKFEIKLLVNRAHPLARRKLPLSHLIHFLSGLSPCLLFVFLVSPGGTPSLQGLPGIKCRTVQDFLYFL